MLYSARFEGYSIFQHHVSTLFLLIDTLRNKNISKEKSGVRCNNSILLLHCFLLLEIIEYDNKTLFLEI